MLKRFHIVLITIVFLLSAYPAGAEGLLSLLGNGTDLKTALSKQTNAVVEGYVLNTAELQRFYSLRDYKKAWDITPKGDHSSIKAFLSSITNFANYHGLILENYPAELLERIIDSNKEEDAQKAELLLTDWLLRMAHDLHGDNINLSHLYPGWNFHRQPLDIPASLDKAIRENRVYDFISELAPSAPEYQRLARELKNYRNIAAQNPWHTIMPGETIRPGNYDLRVADVRARLAAENYVSTAAPNEASAGFYDEELRQAVINYQSRNGLDPDGNIGSKTITAMNVSIEKRIDQIIANMERWRHMPEQFPARYAIVNIAAASLEVFDDGKSIYRGPVVVGRPDRKTPFINSAIRSVIFNPFWHVPDKIARKDILPKLRKDPHYLEKMGFSISGEDYYGEEIDWDVIEEHSFNFRLRQSPGDLNSLGRLKFDFDNKFAVYMHGTPHQELFDKAERNKSSGCVRLRDPVLFASLLLAHNEGNWSEEKVQEEVNKGKTRWLHVSEPMPLFFVYWSAFSPDDDGPINFRNDVYNYDRFLLEQLRKNHFRESSFAILKFLVA